jgi:hypothetical protein
MMPILYAKIGGIAALAGLLLWTGWHFGGMSSDDKLANYRTAVEAQYAANLKTVADALNKQIKDGVAERAAQKKVIDAYDEEKLKPPATAGIVERLRYIQGPGCATSSQLPAAGAMASGVATAGGIPAGISELDRLHQAAFDAADRDSKRLNAAVKLAPKPAP